MLQERTLARLLEETSRLYGDQSFLLDDSSLGSVSYAEILQFACGLERQFDDMGILPGAPVATMLHNCGLAAALFLGVMASGRVLVPLNPIATSYELTYMLDRSRCQALIVDPIHVLSTEFGDRTVIPVEDH